MSTAPTITHGTVASADGTPIAWTRLGEGPDLVMVHCVGISRATTMQPTLPDALAEHFTVWTYDRRGKGESGNAETYDVQREVEDLTAMIGLAAGPVTVYGFSSGATLALIAAEAGAPIARLTLLEPPLYDEADPERAFRAEGERRLAAGNAELRRWFDVEVVGVPAEVLAEMPPPSEELLRDAPSLLHELEFLPGTPARRFASVQQPALFIAAETTAPEILVSGRELEEALPNGQFRAVPGEWHGVDDATLVGLISEAAGITGP